MDWSRAVILLSFSNIRFDRSMQGSPCFYFVKRRKDNMEKKPVSRAVVTVIGKDSVGILAGVSSALAEAGANSLHSLYAVAILALCCCCGRVSDVFSLIFFFTTPSPLHLLNVWLSIEFLTSLATGVLLKVAIA